MAISTTIPATIDAHFLRRLFINPCSAVKTTTFPFYPPKLSFSNKPFRSLSSSRAQYEPKFDEISSKFNEIEDNIDHNNNKKEIEEDGGRVGRRLNVLDANRKLPNLTVKEKKELGAYAHSLGDKLKSQQVGKSGVTDNVVFAFSETLESKELLKLKIHRSCPGELDDVVKQLEQATGSVVVGQIGRTVILYRPSLSKLKAEEKKEESRINFARKRQKAQSAFMMQRKDQRVRRPGGNARFGNRRAEQVPR